MEEELRKRRIRIRIKVLDYRNLLYLIEKPDFINTWSSASNEEQKIVLELIDKGDIDAVHEWIKKNNTFARMRWNELAKHARQRRIPNYSRMSRLELYEAIMEYDNGKKQGVVDLRVGVTTSRNEVPASESGS